MGEEPWELLGGPLGLWSQPVKAQRAALAPAVGAAVGPVLLLALLALLLPARACQCMSVDMVSCLQRVGAAHVLHHALRVTCC